MLVINQSIQSNLPLSFLRHLKSIRNYYLYTITNSSIEFTQLRISFILLITIKK